MPSTAKAPSYQPSEQLVRDLYVRWLKGDSLRKLSAAIGGVASYSAIHSWFRRLYGDHATDTTAMSLARSVLEDYLGTGLVSDDELVEMALRLVTDPEAIKHRSEHSLQMLSNYQVVRESKLMDFIAIDEDRPPIEDLPTELDFLRLPLVLFVNNCVVSLLGSCLS